MNPITHSPADEQPAGPSSAAHFGTDSPTNLPRPGNLTILAVLLAFLLLLAALFYIGWVPHQQQLAQTLADAREVGSDLPAVGITYPRALPAAKNLLLPCDIRPSQETAIYPRASGYLKKFMVDIGDHVETGQLLAEIDTPEVDTDLAQAKAAVQQAQANEIKAVADLDLAKRTLQRFEDLAKRDIGGVTEQQLDEKRSAANVLSATLTAAKATVVAANASVQRLQVLQQFEKVQAPFAGTITTRNYDVGALLSPTNVGAGKELFRLVQTDSLHVFVNVPQTYATNIKNGQPAVLMVRNYPGRNFNGTVARGAGALDPATRTLPFELHFPNATGELYAGMYGQVKLNIAEDHPILVIPSSALIFNAQGLEVALAQNDKVHYQKITVGRDLGTELEVTDGLAVTDQVIANPGERLREGLTIRVLVPTQAQTKGPNPSPTSN